MLKKILPFLLHIYIDFIWYIHAAVALFVPETWFAPSPIYYEASVAGVCLNNRFTALVELSNYDIKRMRRWLYLWGCIWFYHRPCILIKLDGALYNLNITSVLPFPKQQIAD